MIMMDVPPKRLIRSSGRLARSHDFLGLLVARFRRVPEFETWMFARSWMQVPWGLFSLARLAPSHHAQIENSGFPVCRISLWKVHLACFVPSSTGLVVRLEVGARASSNAKKRSRDVDD